MSIRILEIELRAAHHDSESVDHVPVVVDREAIHQAVIRQTTPHTTKDGFNNQDDL